MRNLSERFMWFKSLASRCCKVALKRYDSGEIYKQIFIYVYTYPFAFRSRLIPIDNINRNIAAHKLSKTVNENISDYFMKHRTHNCQLSLFFQLGFCVPFTIIIHTCILRGRNKK